MDIMNWIIVYYVLMAPLVFFALYWAIGQLLGLCSFRKVPGKRQEDSIPNHLVVLPAYKPNDSFINVLDTLERYKLPQTQVYVLFQEARQALVDQVKERFDFVIEEKAFSHLPGNSYQHALKYISSKVKGLQEIDYVMILDKDNFIDKDFFRHIFSVSNSMAIAQGRRVALNSGKGFSTFDAISETLNDTMLRNFKVNFGLIPEISGSGAMIQKNVFTACIDHLDGKAPGFDKNFMVNLITLFPNVKCTYVPSALLKEDKTESAEVYGQQRIRWFGEQYYNAWHHGGELLWAGLRGNMSALDYMLVLFRPPRSIFVVLLCFITVVEILTIGILNLQFWPVVTLSFGLVILSSAITLGKNKLLRKGIVSISKFPMLVLGNIKSSFASMKKENQGVFIHTEH